MEILHSADFDNLKSKNNLDDFIALRGQNKVVFIVKASSKIIEEEFQSINSCVSEYIEDFNITDVERWNAYFVFLATDNVSKELFAKVRSNTFFARKFILGNYNLELNQENIDKLLSDEILFDNLNLNLNRFELMPKLNYIINKIPSNSSLGFILNSSNSDIFQTSLVISNSLADNRQEIYLGDVDELKSIFKKLSIIDLISSLITNYNKQIIIKTTDENFASLLKNKLQNLNIKENNIININSDYIEETMYDFIIKGK